MTPPDWHPTISVLSQNTTSSTGYKYHSFYHTKLTNSIPASALLLLPIHVLFKGKNVVLCFYRQHYIHRTSQIVFSQAFCRLQKKGTFSGSIRLSAHVLATANPTDLDQI